MAAPGHVGIIVLYQLPRFKGGNSMADDQGTSAGIDLVAKILVISGLLFIIVGVFVFFFVSITVGIVVLAVGVVDLAMSVVLPKIASKQGRPADKA